MTGILQKRRRRNMALDYKDYEVGQETRTEDVRVRLTQAEKDLMQREAQKLGISMSALLRVMLNKWVENNTL
jgi:hypothetical protein